MALTSGGRAAVDRERGATRVLAAVTAAALLLGPMAGCSLLFVNPPPPPDQRGPVVHCTESQVLPVLDMFVAGFQLVRALIAYSSRDSDYAGATLNREGEMIAATGLFALFGGSSAIGFSTTAGCREARNAANAPRPPSRRPRLGVVPAPATITVEEVPLVPASPSERVEGAPDGGAPPFAPDAGAAAPPTKPPERYVPAGGQRSDPE